MISATGAGAAVGGYASAGFFGGRGFSGWVLALVGAVLSTLIGAVLAGAAAGYFPQIVGMGKDERIEGGVGDVAFGSLFGVSIVFAGIGSFPSVASTWLVGMSATHLLASRLRNLETET